MMAHSCRGLVLSLAVSRAHLGRTALVAEDRNRQFIGLGEDNKGINQATERPGGVYPAD